MGRVPTSLVCALAALTLAACGTSASEKADKTATASLKAELLQQSNSKASPFTFSDTQAQCTASRLVSGIGTPSLQKYGLLNADDQATTKTLDDVVVSAEHATTIVDAIIDCLGPDNFTTALKAAVATSLPGDKASSQRTCVESKLTISALKPMLVATLSGNQSSAEKFYADLASCIPKK